MDPELYAERIAIVQEGCAWSAAEAEAYCRTLFCDDPPMAEVAPAPSVPAQDMEAFRQDMEAFRQDMRTLFCGDPPVARQESPTVASPLRGGLTLRPYQEDAVQAVLGALGEGEHPVVNIATGGGKSLVIAALCAKLPGRILVVTHRKRLIQQNSAQLARYGLAPEDIGVYSAGLRQRDTRHRVLFAGRDSIAHRMDALQTHGAFDYIIVDECHLVAPPKVASRYATIFRACPPGAQRIGLSATPSRQGVPLWGLDDTWFTTCAYTASIDDLTTAGYLTPMSTILTAKDVDLSAVKIQAGEFVVAQASEAMSERVAAEAALDEACQLAQHRQAWMVFCCDVTHTELVAALLRQRGIPCAPVHGQHADADNQAALAAFEAGELRALVSCEMLTTGVDLPRVDCGILLRPTLSKELLVQMLGRLTRLSPDKQDSLILDYAGNLDRHGDLGTTIATHRTAEREARDAVREAQEQEARAEQERQARHEASLLRKGLYAVQSVEYSIGTPKDHPERGYLRVTYLCPTHPRKRVVVYLCVQGYADKARQPAIEWFRRRRQPCPLTTTAAWRLAGQLPQPVWIGVVEEGSFFRLTHELFV